MHKQKHENSKVLWVCFVRGFSIDFFPCNHVFLKQSLENTGGWVTYVPIYALLMAWSFMFNCDSVFLLATFVIFHDLLHFLDINLQYCFYGKEQSMERYLVCNLNIKYF
jgi:hypothetical protein